MPEKIETLDCPGERILKTPVEVTAKATGWNCYNEAKREATDAYNTKAYNEYKRLIRVAETRFRCPEGCVKEVIPVHLWNPDTLVTIYKPSPTSSNLDKAEAKATGEVSIKVLCKKVSRG